MNHTGCVIRAAGPGDAAAIASLTGQLGYPADEEETARRLEAILPHPDRAVYVAELSTGQVVGWVYVCGCLLLEAEAEAQVWGLVVDGEYRGMGIGRRLMDQAESWARERGFRSVSLRSNVLREEAHAFYRSIGYKVAKTSLVFRKDVE